MSIRPFRDIKRRVTKVINVGKVKIGGTNPISVQSMTNTLTKNVKETLNQINSISEVGGDIIRVSLSSDPVDEVKAGYEILKSLGIRSRGVNIISCPSCARQAFPVIETVK